MSELKNMIMNKPLGLRNAYFIIKRRLPLSDNNLIDAILERNEFDFRLYEFAKDMLDELISFQDADFYDEVESFKELNEEYIARYGIPRY